MSEEIKEVTGETETPKTEPTFTQADVDKIVKDRLAREKKKYPSKEELTSYNEWKESQKTQEEKVNEQISKLEEDKNNYYKELTQLKQEKVIGKLNVKPEFVEFVASKVNSLVTEDKDFETALQQYVEKNPHYTNVTVEKPKVKTGTDTQRIDESSSRETAMRKRMGL